MMAHVATLRDAGCLRVACPTTLVRAGSYREGAIKDERANLETLLAAANAGDGKALAAFLHAVMPIIRRVVKARGRGLPVDQHEDIVQDVLLAIHLKRQSWNPQSPVRPWLYAVARYKVVDAFRRRGSYIHLPVEDFADIIAQDQQHDPLSEHDTARMLAQIDSRSAAIVRAIGIDGDGANEVGARLSMSDGAVRVAFHRAVKKLAAIARRSE